MKAPAGTPCPCHPPKGVERTCALHVYLCADESCECNCPPKKKKLVCSCGSRIFGVIPLEDVGNKDRWETKLLLCPQCGKRWVTDGALMAGWEEWMFGAKP